MSPREPPSHLLSVPFEEDRQVAQLRIPPSSVEAEETVLGSLLIENSAWDLVGDVLTEADFYRTENKLVFAAVGVLCNSCRPADAITVFEHLQRQGKADEAGGLPYIASLARSTPSAANVRRYAEIVRERSVLRRLIVKADEIATSAFNPDGRSVDQIVDEAEAKILAVAEIGSRMKQGFQDMEKLVVQVLDRVQELADRPNELAGTSTGYEDLDRLTAGLHGGDLVILAARPSMGKTALAINIAEHVALKEGLPVAVFSMEMGAAQLATRVLGSLGRINQQNLRTGKLTDEEWPRLTVAVETMRQVALHIDETGGLTIGELRANARRLARRCGGKLGLVVVDYLQLMTVPGGGRNEENRATAVGDISRGLKLLAKELDCPVIALSQLNRAVEARQNRRPMMSDLRESGAIEQDADVIMFIYRDDYYNKDSREPGVAEIIVSKQRSGPTGTVRLAWLSHLTRFENLAPDYMQHMQLRPASKPRAYTEDV